MKPTWMLVSLIILAGCSKSCSKAAPPGPTPSPVATITMPSTSTPASPTAPATPTPSTSSAATNDPKAGLDPETSISGTVKFSGEKAPKRSKIDASADANCQAQHDGDHPLLKEEVVVNENKTLKNVIVWVKGGLDGRSFPPASGKVSIHQKGCQYNPHVLVVQVGQGIEVVNDDIGVTHNVHPLPKVNPAVPENVGQKPGASNTWPMPSAEAPFFVKCDMHPWMGAWCAVAAHPFFAVTGDDGSFALKGLPPGEFVVEAWHEKYGAKTMTVKVAAKEKAKVDFAYDGK